MQKKVYPQKNGDGINSAEQRCEGAHLCEREELLEASEPHNGVGSAWVEAKPCQTNRCFAHLHKHNLFRNNSKAGSGAIFKV